MANFTREEIEDIVHKLERASLAETNLDYANLHGANLRGPAWTGASTTYNADTHWPPQNSSLLQDTF